MKKTGLFIAIEGIDGSGKSTLSKNLAALFSKTRTVLLTREPGGTDLGVKIRTFLHESAEHIEKKAQYLLFAADRAQHVARVILPHIEQGYLVISDRFSDSSVAYQGYGNQLSIDTIKRINEWATQMLEPDLTIFLQISVDEAMSRLQKTRTNLSFYERKDFLERVAFGFLELYKKRQNVITINAQLQETEIAMETYKRIESWIKTR